MRLTDLDGLFFRVEVKEAEIEINDLTANLSGHHIVEHEDGTISVSPSILVNRGRADSWHGFLERGVWRSC